MIDCMGGDPVVLRTDRLLLRPIEERDVEPLASLYADPEVVRYLRPLDTEGTRRQVTTFRREWHERGCGPFAIIDRSTGHFLGRSGLHYWPDLDETEVGWVLRRDVWGRGYATEAGRTSLDWGFREHRLRRIVAIVAVGNSASSAVAGRLGMSVLREDEIFDRPVIVYARSAPGPGS
jgi:RimJ/RimL family protein N-acetyltransferase